MNALTFSGFDEKTIVEVLKVHSGSMMSARDIVEFLYEKDPEFFNKIWEERTKNYVHIGDFIMQLSAEVHRKVANSSKVSRHENGNRVYYKIRENRKESPLYPAVIRYLRESHRVFAMRIDEKKLLKGNGGVRDSKRFPDIVGMEEDSSFGKKWDNDIMAMSNMTSGKKIGIWSVEVKYEVSRRTVRENLSQTLGNSSWANRAYLAAAKFSTASDGMPDEHTARELHACADEHGIGAIKIDQDDFRNSKIIIEAKEREVNWNTANRLMERSKDFIRFIRIYRRYYESNTGDEEWNSMIKLLSDSGFLEEISGLQK